MKTTTKTITSKLTLPGGTNLTEFYQQRLPARVEKTKPEVLNLVARPREEKRSLAEAAERYRLMQVEELLRIGGYVRDPKDPDNWIEGTTIKRQPRPKPKRKGER